MPRPLCFVLFAFALATATATTAWAAKYDATRVVTAQTKEAFADQYQTVMQGLQPGGKYELVRGRERETVQRRMGEMQRILDAYEPGKRLQDTQLMALLSAQEEVNGILNQRDKDRLVCTNSIPTGSHRPVNNCKRYGDIEASRKATRKFMEDELATPCASRECKGN
jgi:hypothetical protein